MTAALARLVFRVVRLVGVNRMARISGGTARLLAPLIPENRLALRNLANAFPEKSPAELKNIRAGVWNNLARTMCEYAVLRELSDFDRDNPEASGITIVGAEHFKALSEDGKPALIFAAHLANWELLAVAAARFGLPLTALFHPPRNQRVREDLMRERQALMGGLVPTNRPGASFLVAGAMERGEHIGILVDQRMMNGPAVPFFDAPAPSNPMVARLARQFECPVHGARTVRLPGNRYKLELTPPLDLPRAPDGRIDVPGTTALIQKVVEGWVREHPEQWLWLHDRWGDRGRRNRG